MGMKPMCMEGAMTVINHIMNDSCKLYSLNTYQGPGAGTTGELRCGPCPQVAHGLRAAESTPWGLRYNRNV